MIDSVTLVLGDCVEIMRSMPEASVDAIVCDPPYGLEFMGKEWDRLLPSKGKWSEDHEPTLEAQNDTPHHRAAVKQPAYLKRCAKCGGSSSGNWNRCKCENPEFRIPDHVRLAAQEWHYAWAVEALRVLKPGGHLLAFGGTRTFHRLACAIEDAGFEIRDTITWHYGSGFPKSLDVSKAIDKAAGAVREVVGNKGELSGRNVANHSNSRSGRTSFQTGFAGDVTIASTDVAKQWEGWGTALKPATEFIVVARKPLIGTVAANVLAHGTGAINIDGCRVGFASEGDKAAAFPGGRLTSHGSGSLAGPGQAQDAERSGFVTERAAGRWPANLVHDGSDEVLAGFPETTGVGHHPRARGTGGLSCDGHGGQSNLVERYDSSKGSAARFFYCAKAAKKERGAENTHPTVKPIALMRYLVRLVTPPGGVVLDPFMGSGTTGLAAMAEGFRFIGIEQSPEYMEIARGRIAGQGGVASVSEVIPPPEPPVEPKPTLGPALEPVKPKGRWMELIQAAAKRKGRLVKRGG